MREFRVNKYITLKLENGKSNIYIKNKLFRTCAILLLNIPINEVKSLNEVQSIDEIASEHFNDSEGTFSESIPLDVIFWGHCSNLQAWFENKYNSRLLHRNLAFPLLKELYEVGDPSARKFFKEEIVKRFSSNHRETTEYLMNEGYLDYLDYNELEIMVENSAIITKSLEEIESLINSGCLVGLSNIELLLYSKFQEIKNLKKSFMKNINLSLEFLNSFLKFVDEGLHLGFLYSNRTILKRLIYPIIVKISKSSDQIKNFFLKEINDRLKSPNILNYEILKEMKEIYVIGYKPQASLDGYL